MKTRVFQSGHSRAVRLPKEIRLALGEAEIEMRGEEIVVRPCPSTLEAAYDALAGMPRDVFAEPRRDNPPQSRRWDDTAAGRARRARR